MKTDMHATKRSIVVALGVMAAVGLLSGCGILEPTRDADGLIVRPTVMPSPDVRVGDCFNFLDGSELSYATVVPCADPHSHVVVSTGTLSESKVALAGGTQPAVDMACERPFDAFAELRASGQPKPKLEFIVSQEQKPGGLVINYSCIATVPT